MKRLLHQTLLRLLIVGLLGPMAAYAWSVAVRSSLSEEEHGSYKELAVLSHQPRLAAGRGIVPHTRPPRAQRAHRPVSQPLPPAQALLPRVVEVWQPWQLGSDDDDPLSR